jgi:hypothetical protein
MLVEASDKRALSSGVRSVSIRIARYVNELLGRKGRLWADRWFGRDLTTARQVRIALVYVLANFRKHARKRPPRGIDPFSSGGCFDGFRGWRPEHGRIPWAGRPPPPFSHDEANAGLHRAWVVRPAQSVLARALWRRYGPIRLGEGPSSLPDAGVRLAAKSP